VTTGTDGAPGLLPRWTRASIAVAAVFTAAVGALVVGGHLGAVPFALWLSALLVVVRHALVDTASRPLGRRDWLLLLAVALLAAFFRLYRLDEIPFGLWVDELAVATNAAELAGRPFLPFGSTPLFADGPHWVHSTNLYLYACAPLLRLTGYSTAGVKLISLLPGVAAPPLLFLLARRVLPAWPAALAAALLAVSHWHVTLSRWGFDEVLLTAMAVAAVAFLYDGLEHGKAKALLLAGVIVGLAQYTYLAARLFAVASLAVLVLRLAWLRQRRQLDELAAFCAAFLVAVMPLLAYWFTHPEVFAVRVGELSIVGRALGGEPTLLLHNVRDYALMFFTRGDLNPRHNVPGQPMLDPLTALLFAAGIVVAALQWRRPGPQLLLAWLLFGLLGGVASLAEGGANAYRTGHVAPACALLAALAVHAVFERARAAGSRMLERAVAAVAVAAVVVSAAVTTVSYFVVRPSSRECFMAVREGVYAELLRRPVERLLAAGVPVRIDRSASFKTSVLQIDGLTRRRFPAADLSWVDAAARPDEVPERSVLFVGMPAVPRLPDALRRRPALLIPTAFGDPVFVAIAPDKETLDRVAASTRAAAAR
jgi:4-amino-4-deoxy-L-arabinose transferase-like glycosyltransferase